MEQERKKQQLDERFKEQGISRDFMARNQSPLVTTEQNAEQLASRNSFKREKILWPSDLKKDFTGGDGMQAAIQQIQDNQQLMLDQMADFASNIGKMNERIARLETQFSDVQGVQSRQRQQVLDPAL